jgi:hypothetical protein
MLTSQLFPGILIITIDYVGIIRDGVLKMHADNPDNTIYSAPGCRAP